MNTETYELEKALATATNKKIRIRCEAVLLRCGGWILSDIAEEVGCCIDSVWRWHQIFATMGIKVLCHIKSPGRTKIVPKTSYQLCKSVILASQSHCRPARGEDIQALLLSRGFRLCLSSVYNLLSDLDFSYKTCRPYHPRRSEEEMTEWKSNLPKVIKKVKKSNPDSIIKLFFQDETRFGQQGIMVRQWSPVGERPARMRQVDFKYGWIFGVACPETGQRYFLVGTETNTKFMQIFLNTFSKNLGRGVHAIVILDNAAWHTSVGLKTPSNITLHFLPPYWPELNPIENLWDFIKDNFLCNKIFRDLKEVLNEGVASCRKVTKEIIMSVCERNYAMI